MLGARPTDALVSIVVPVLDEEDCVGELARRVGTALTEVPFELIFVDDGSRDRTRERLAALREADERVHFIRFTRNFGHQAALAAGLRLAKGDCVVTMDGDLQHPPELLPELLAHWRKGADVVQTIRRVPVVGHRSAKETTARGFYRVIGLLSRVPMAEAGADFRLMDRRVVDSFNALPEHFLFTRGLVPWLGFEEQRVEYDVGLRFAGRSKFRLAPMLRLAFDGIFSFSVVPLRLISWVGAVTTLLGVLYGAFALVAHLTERVEASGWTSLIVVILVFGGVQLCSLGIVSEYVGRIYEEVKRRPRYIVDSVDGSDPR